MTFIPAHSVVQAPGTNPTKTAFVLHGILGNQKNWRSFARRFVSQNQDWELVLVDHRNHGKSIQAHGPHTVRAAAEDLVRLATQVGTPDAVIGHSFGGKVALVFSTLCELEQCWVLDSIPTLQSKDAREELRRVFQALEDAGAPFTSRDEMPLVLRAQGVAESLVLWMTTNLTRSELGFDWSFHLDHCRDMIEDYFNLDATTILRTATTPIHLVHAERNAQWTPALVNQIEAIHPSVHTHLLEDADHWVHVDNPNGLHAIMHPYFTRT